LKWGGWEIERAVNDDLPNCLLERREKRAKMLLRKEKMEEKRSTRTEKLMLREKKRRHVSNDLEKSRMVTKEKAAESLPKRDNKKEGDEILLGETTVGGRGKKSGLISWNLYRGGNAPEGKKTEQVGKS